MKVVRLVRSGLVLGLASIALAWLQGSVASAQIEGADLHGQSGAQFGLDVANVGDTDGDGIDDLLVGEYLWSSSTLSSTGRASLYSGATMTLIRRNEGTQADEWFGRLIGAAGDVDRDGRADYVVGSTNTDHGGHSIVGMAAVYSGADGHLLWDAYGSTLGEQFGSSAAGLGDVDSDGNSDVAVGCMNLHYVKVLDEDAQTIWTITSPNDDGFGASVARCGDVDSDGVPDFAVGEPFADATYLGVTIAHAGLVHVYSGATALELYRFGGQSPDDTLGRTLANLGDIDGDGIDDLIAGSAYAKVAGAPTGLVVVVSGKDGKSLARIDGAHAGDRFGVSVAGIGDFDHDGVRDYAVGACDADDAGVDRGLVQVFSGAKHSVLWETYGVANAEIRDHALGIGVAGGDFNGDGIADVVMGDELGETWSSFFSQWYATGGAFVRYGCPSWSDVYGSGWAGKNGVPGLTALDEPVPGSRLTIQLDNSLGATTAGLMFLGFTQVSVRTGKGGTILVAPFLTIPLALPATGLLMTGALPNDPALFGFDIDLQALEVDAFASEGLSFTAGLHLHCGFDLP